MNTDKSYFLCTQAVVDFAKPTEVSKPFKSGYKQDKDKYYVAVLDFKEMAKYYDEVIEPNNNNHKKKYIDFWLWECAGGQMDVSKITIAGCKRNGLFNEIEWKIGLTTEKNRALTIYELSRKYNCTPIELINKIKK